MAYRENGTSDGLPSIHRTGLVTSSTTSGVRFGRFDDDVARPGSPNTSQRRMLLELQEQMKVLKDDLRKKDNLITQLSSSEPVYPPKATDTSTFEALLSSALQPNPNRTSEIAALQVKVDNLQGQLRECQAQGDCKDIRIKELKTENEVLKENEARLSAVIETLRKQTEDLEARAGSVDAVKSKTEIVVTTLQRENNEARERTLELEGRLRTLLSEREEMEQQKISFEKKFQEIMSQTCSIIRVDDVSGSSVEKMISKLSDIMQENAVLKGKLATLNETLANTELETKASRETIMRLVSEVGREQKNTTQHTTELQNLKLERDNAMADNREMKRQVDLLEERLEQTTKAWTATRTELEEREARLNRIDRDYRERSYVVKNVEGQFVAFRENLANLLGDAFSEVPPMEDAIKNKVREIISSNMERKSVIETMEQKLHRVTDQLESLRDKQDINERRARRAEADLLDMEKRMNDVVGDVSSSEMVRDGLRRDKDHFMKFMEKLASVMKVDRIEADIGFDMSGEALLSRASQLVKLETDAVADRSTHIYNLQRKVKSMKQQLESKDLHLDLLRKKISSMEEKILGKTDLEREKDSESTKVRKMAKELERTRDHLKAARNEVVDLKAQLMECSNLKLTCIEQDKEILGLEKTLEKLERVRQMQAKKIQGMRQNIETSEKDTGEKRLVAENTVQALSSELRTTKRLMGEATEREKELLELRQVLARMLGLDIASLAVPNYEIINRLEKLIHAYHSAGLTGLAIDRTIDDMEDGFRAGYEDARRFLGPRGRSPKRPGHKHSEKTRPRSVSPVKRDPRQY